MIKNLFPKTLQKEVLDVQQILGEELKYDGAYVSVWKLSNSDIVEIPYRLDIDISISEHFGERCIIQKNIANCILTRSYDGYVRQRSLEMLLKEDVQEWMLPFVIKLGDEYVDNIVDIIYKKLKEDCVDITTMRQFCYNNKENLLRGYSRMISYWNVYYRKTYSNLFNYIGYKLYHEYLWIDELKRI